MSSKRNRIQNQISSLKESIQRDQAKIRKLQTKDKAAKRKARTRELIQIGGLAEIAELLRFDRGALLGLFIKGREMLQDENTFLAFKQIGDRTLSERAQERKSRRRPKTNQK